MDAGHLGHTFAVAGVAHPGGGRQAGRVADEPGVLVVLGGARLAGLVTADLGGLAGSLLHHLLEAVGDLGRLAGGEHLGPRGGEVLHEGAVGPLDPQHHPGGDPGAPVGEGGVAGGHVEHRHLTGAEHDRGHRRQLGADPELVGGLDDARRPELDHELRVDGVHRLLGGLQQGGAPAAATAPDLPVLPGVGVGDHEVLGGPQDRFDRVTGPHRLGQGEGLERGARLAAGAPTAGAGGQVHLADVEVGAAHHGLDLALVVDGHDRAGRVAGLVQGGGDGVVGRLLHAQVEGGVDAEPAAVEGVVAVALAHQLLADVLHEVLGGGVVGGLGVAAPAHVDVLGPDERQEPVGEVEGPGVRHGVGGGADLALLAHAGQDGATPAAGLGRLAVGLGGLGRADEPGQQGRLGQAELLDVVAEVGARRRLHAVGPPAEVHRVEVALEDLGLGVLLLELHGHHRFLHLAVQGALPGEVNVLHVLLGDGGTTLARALGADIGEGRPGDADGVDAAVLEEVPVLGRQHRVAHHLGHAVELHVDAVLLAVQLGHGVGLVALAARHRRVAHEAGLVLDGRWPWQLQAREHETGPRQPGHGEQAGEEQPASPPPEDRSLLDGARAGALQVVGRGGSASSHGTFPARAGPGSGQARQATNQPRRSLRQLPGVPRRFR